MASVQGSPTSISAWASSNIRSSIGKALTHSDTKPMVVFTIACVFNITLALLIINQLGWMVQPLPWDTFMAFSGPIMGGMVVLATIAFMNVIAVVHSYFKRPPKTELELFQETISHLQPPNSRN